MNCNRQDKKCDMPKACKSAGFCPVLDQKAIDSLLGFEVEEGSTYRHYLAAARCDLQREVAELLKEIEDLLEDAIDPAKRGEWRKRAVHILKRLRQEHMFD